MGRSKIDNIKQAFREAYPEDLANMKIAEFEEELELMAHYELR